MNDMFSSLTSTPRAALMRDDIAQIVNTGWRLGKSSIDVAEEILREFDAGAAQCAPDSRLEKAVEILRRRAAGYESRATAIFSGRIMANELRGNAREIEALADSPVFTSTNGGGK